MHLRASFERAAVAAKYFNAAVFTVIVLYFAIIPGVIITMSLRDPGFSGEGMPRFAYRLHKTITPRYEEWARKRVEDGSAAGLTIDQISSTEWPLFGTVFYLWATESLQDDWDEDEDRKGPAPMEYARGAVEACARLLTDPNHASWVRQHWGDDYLERQNLFFRELLIAGLTSHYRLTGNDEYLPLLRSQVESLSKELDESPYGLLEDYPGECYPTDVLGAIAAIQRADAVLGTDHSEFISRAARAFRGDLLDGNGLPPYTALAPEGKVLQPARGCGLSFMLTFAPELWRNDAKDWYGRYEEHFWQEGFGAGFREFSRGADSRDWYADVDAGPILWGYGPAACGFGLGAARANGRFDHAYPLSAEMLVTVWPLPNGRLLVPRILSNMSDAPMLGEVSVLFAMTRRPVEGLTIVKGSRIPRLVYALLAAYFFVGVVLILVQYVIVRRWRRRKDGYWFPAVKMQVIIWSTLVAAGIISLFVFGLVPGIVLLLVAQLAPVSVRKRKAIQVKEQS